MGRELTGKTEMGAPSGQETDLCPEVGDPSRPVSKEGLTLRLSPSDYFRYSAPAQGLPNLDCISEYQEVEAKATQLHP